MIQDAHDFCKDYFSFYMKPGFLLTVAAAVLLIISYAFNVSQLTPATWPYSESLLVEAGLLLLVGFGNIWLLRRERFLTLLEVSEEARKVVNQLAAVQMDMKQVNGPPILFSRITELLCLTYRE
jgi:hypothetical protein